MEERTISWEELQNWNKDSYVLVDVRGETQT